MTRRNAQDIEYTRCYHQLSIRLVDNLTKNSIHVYSSPNREGSNSSRSTKQDGPGKHEQLEPGQGKILF